MKLTFGNNSVLITGPALAVSASQRWGEEEEEEWYRLLTTSPTTPGLMRSEEEEEESQRIISPDQDI